jgi:hypothetical protein
MDEHDDDLASEVVEGEQIENDAFNVVEEDADEGETARTPETEGNSAADDGDGGSEL